MVVMRSALSPGRQGEYRNQTDIARVAPIGRRILARYSQG